MNKPVCESVLPKRILYTMLRVTELDKSIAFYQDMLGMKELRRETFPEGQFTLVFMGYGNESEAMIELTYNWGEHQYDIGSAYGHIALGVDDIHNFEIELEKHGVEIIRKAGPMTFAPIETGHKEVISFILDPDGYKIELIQS